MTVVVLSQYCWLTKDETTDQKKDAESEWKQNTWWRRDGFAVVLLLLKRPGTSLYTMSCKVLSDLGGRKTNFSQVTEKTYLYALPDTPFLHYSTYTATHRHFIICIQGCGEISLSKWCMSAYSKAITGWSSCSVGKHSKEQETNNVQTAAAAEYYQ